MPENIYDPMFVQSLFDEMSKTYGITNYISSFGSSIVDVSKSEVVASG